MIELNARSRHQVGLLSSKKYSFISFPPRAGTLRDTFQEPTHYGVFAHRNPVP